MTPRPPEPRPWLSSQSPSRYALGPSRGQPRHTHPPGDQATSTPTTTDAKWSHFKRPQWGQRKRPLRSSPVGVGVGLDAMRVEHKDEDLHATISRAQG